MKRHCIFTALISVILMLALLLSATTYAVTKCEDGEHLFSVELIQAATGDTDGLRRYTCDICGYSYDETIPATGHHWGEWTTDVEPGCTESGHRHCVCNVCGEKKSEEIPALGHEYTREETPPTCTKSGIITYTCNRCGDSYTETGAPALGHNYQPGQAQNAEAGMDRWQEYTCTVCGDSYRVAISAFQEEARLPVKSEDPALKDSVPTEPDVTAQVESQERETAFVPVVIGSAETSDGGLTPNSQTRGGMNAMDIVFACGIAATAAGFSLFSAPYIKVLSWGKKKKREIDLRRKEQ